MKKHLVAFSLCSTAEVTAREKLILEALEQKPYEWSKVILYRDQNEGGGFQRNEEKPQFCEHQRDVKAKKQAHKHTDCINKSQRF